MPTRLSAATILSKRLRPPPLSLLEVVQEVCMARVVYGQGEFCLVVQVCCVCFVGARSLVPLEPARGKPLMFRFLWWSSVLCIRA